MRLLRRSPPRSEPPVRVIVGLRNPGSDYEGTRHNVGAEVAQLLVDRHDAGFRRGPSRLRAELADVRLDGRRVLVMLPLSFMNESGGPVRAVLDYHGVDPDDMLVIHDDIDLPFGRLRLQTGGGTGGHNGLKSLERSLATREFHRLKVGVGRPPERMDPASYVLQRFAKAERPEVDRQVEDACAVAERWIADPRTAREMASTRRDP